MIKKNVIIGVGGYSVTQEDREHQERTAVLSNERTYAAWIRTGLASLASAMVFAKILSGVIPETSMDVITVILIISSGLFFFLAAWRYQHVGVRMVSTKTFGAPILLLMGISLLLIFASLLSLVGLFV